MRLIYSASMFFLLLLHTHDQKEPSLKQTISWINLYGSDILSNSQPEYADSGTNTVYNLRVSEDSIWFYMYQTFSMKENGTDRYPHFSEYYKGPTSSLMALKANGVFFLDLMFSEKVVRHESKRWKGKGIENVEVVMDTVKYENYLSIITGERRKKVNAKKLKPLVKALNRYVALINENSVNRDIFD